MNNNTSQMTPSGPPDIAVDLPIDGTSEVAFDTRAQPLFRRELQGGMV